MSEIGRKGKPPLKKLPSDNSLHLSDDEGDKSDGGDKKSDGETTPKPLTSTDRSSSFQTDASDDLENFDLSGKSSTSDATNNNTYLPKVQKFLKKQAKAFVKNFIDYGPPYNGKGFDVALVNECAKPVINLFEIHKYLNDRVDPNLPDPDDLYFTPIHWCARNGHVTAMKMLRRAGARVNVTNEMGLTPLQLAVMMKLPPTRRGDQIKVIKYLLENNADPNIRDKGGACAIDYAASNQDIEIIKLLFEFGAKVRRENYILVAKRQPILEKVVDPECYRLIYEKLIQEENEFYEQQQKISKLQKEKDYDKYYEKLHKSLDTKKTRRQLKLKEIQQKQELDELQTNYYQQLEKENEERRLKKAKSKTEFYGEWKKQDTITNHWEFSIKEFGKVTRDGIYEQNRKVMAQLHEEHNFDSNNKKWKQLTGHKTGLEIQQPLKKLFYLEENDISLSKPTTAGSNTRSGQGSRLRDRNDKDIDYRDQNDDALKGIDDLEGLLEY